MQLNSGCPDSYVEGLSMKDYWIVNIHESTSDDKKRLNCSALDNYLIFSYVEA